MGETTKLQFIREKLRMKKQIMDIINSYDDVSVKNDYDNTIVLYSGEEAAEAVKKIFALCYESDFSLQVFANNYTTSITFEIDL